MKPAIPVRAILLLLGGVILLALLVARFTVEVPVMQEVANPLTNGLAIDLLPKFYPPYHFVVGTPGAVKIPPDFQGEIELRGLDGRIESIPMSSGSATPCNWLHDAAASGFVLAWKAPQDFNDFLHRGVACRVRVSFTKPLPAHCTLWFASMKHVSIFNRDS